MNLRNLFTLTIKSFDFNLLAQRPDLIKKLRELTLAPYSGMNHELNWMSREAIRRKINCQVFLAYRSKDLVGWALLSNEDTDFTFTNETTFRSEDGWLFQVYIGPDHRRQGIGSELYKKARKQTKNDTFCICPWDYPSYGFFTSFNSQNTKCLRESLWPLTKQMGVRIDCGRQR